MSDPAGSRASRRAAQRAGRRACPPCGVHLIDVENLADTVAPDPAQTRHLQTRYPQVLTVAAGRSRPSRVRQSRIRARARPGTGQ